MVGFNYRLTTTYRDYNLLVQDAEQPEQTEVRELAQNLLDTVQLCRKVAELQLFFAMTRPERTNNVYYLELPEYTPEDLEKAWRATTKVFDFAWKVLETASTADVITKIPNLSGLAVTDMVEAAGRSKKDIPQASKIVNDAIEISADLVGRQYIYPETLTNSRRIMNAAMIQTNMKCFCWEAVTLLSGDKVTNEVSFRQAGLSLFHNFALEDSFQNLEYECMNGHREVALFALQAFGFLADQIAVWDNEATGQAMITPLVEFMPANMQKDLKPVFEFYGIDTAQI